MVSRESPAEMGKPWASMHSRSRQHALLVEEIATAMQPDLTRRWQLERSCTMRRNTWSAI